MWLCLAAQKAEGQQYLSAMSSLDFPKKSASLIDLFGKCNSHLEKASFVYDAVWTPLSKWRGGGG
ncbi:MAG: hypothetical protein SH857_19050, partial [Chitinophagales bacterium]|nr:hypothetical protein [Chitinophagales bacterium]